MVKGEQIPKAKRLAIQSMRGYKTASELAQTFGVSERSVTRIWSDDATEKIAQDLKNGALEVKDGLDQYGHYHAIEPEMVQMLTVKQYFQLLEAREYYRAMRDAYPNNCAWGNLEEKYNRQINDLLRIMGAWYGLERQKDPQTSADVKTKDLSATVYIAPRSADSLTDDELNALLGKLAHDPDLS